MKTPKIKRYNLKMQSMKIWFGNHDWHASKVAINPNGQFNSFCGNWRCRKLILHTCHKASIAHSDHDWAVRVNSNPHTCFGEPSFQLMLFFLTLKKGCLSISLVFLTRCNRHNSSFVWNSFDDCHCWNETRLMYLSNEKKINKTASFLKKCHRWEDWWKMCS